MNLATKDIRHNFGRFALTTVGIGLLLMIVMGMGGIYRGLIREATLLVEKIGADLWLVQGSTRGPFAEISRVPANRKTAPAPFPAWPGRAGSFRTPFSGNIAGGLCGWWCRDCRGPRTGARGFHWWPDARCARRTSR